MKRTLQSVSFNKRLSVGHADEQMLLNAVMNMGEDDDSAAPM